MHETFRSVCNEAERSRAAAAEHVRATGQPRVSAQTLAVCASALSGLLVFNACAQSPPSSNELPTGARVSAGQASVAQSGANMVISQGSDRAAINWHSFNVGSGAQVQFIQPSANSVALNRVLSNDPSQIFGRITANGQVILMNPAGVYFGPSARIDVGGLIATTKSLSDADFMAGRSRFKRYGSTGRVINEGELKAALGGYIALLAPEVRNQGAIIAQMGTVALAAGEVVDLKFDSNNRLTSLRVEPSQIQSLIDNRHAVKAPGGLVIISAQSMDRLVGGVIKNSGVLEANDLHTDGGRIVLSASRKVENSGELNVSSTAGHGGSVSVQGPQIDLNEGTRIDATGATGGGTVLVGGNWQGSADPLLQATGQPSQAATTVFMASGASIDASATQQGHGGKVVLWSDINDPASLTSVHGQINARAGVGGGDGGQVETSGHTLNTDGIAVRASASGGQKGLWLLDPSDSTITATQVSSYLTSLNSGTDVINFTTGAITWSSGSLLKNAGGDATLTLRAGTHLTISDGVNITSSSGALNLVLWSGYQDAGFRGWTSIGSGAINTNGGHVWMGDGAQNLEGTTTWNGLTVSSHYATSFIPGTPGLRLNGTSINSSGGDIYLKGRYSVTSDTADSMSGIQASNVALNSGGGSLTLEARIGNTRSTHSGISLAGSTSLSGTGDLKFEVNATTSVPSIRTNGTLSLSRGAGNITWIADNFSAATFNATTSGNLTVQPFSTSFHSSGFSLSRISPLGGTLSASRLTIGKLNNTAAITTDVNASIAGPITVYGGDITINAGLTATGGNTITLQGSGNISTGVGGYVSADSLLLSGGNVSLTNSTSNAVGTLAASGVSGLTYVDSHELTVGTVGSTNGISASGAVSIATKAGDLTVAQSVTTTNTTANALVLNADMDASAGSSSGGNLVFTGSPTVSVGSGGVGKLFTGSVSGSTGLSGLSNLASGSGRFRYNSDETITRYTTTLSAGLNAIFREQPSATTGSLILAMTYGDALPVITAMGTVNGDAPGYSITSRLNSTSGNIRASASPYAITETLTGLGYRVNSSITASAGTLSVNPKALTMSGLSVPTTKVYDGLTSATVSGTYSLQSAVASGTGTNSDGKRYTNDVVSITGTAIGTYNSRDVATASSVTFSGLSLTGADAGNYSLTIQPSASATITPKALSMTGLTVPSSKVYDGTQGAVVSGTPTLLAAGAAGSGTTADGKPYTGDVVNFTGTAIGTYNSKDVASASTVSFSGLGLSNTNYSLTIQSSASATITPKALTISGLNSQNKVYDGTTNASVVGTAVLQAAVPAGTGNSSDGKPYSSDSVGLTGSVIANFNSLDVASANQVAFTGLTLSGAGSGNYTLTPHALDTSARITKASLQVIVNDDAKFVIEPDRPGFNGVSYSGFVNGETASALGGSLILSRSNASTNTAGIYAGVLNATGLTSGNYAISYQAGKYTVVPSNQLLVEVTGASTTYGSAVQYAISSVKYERNGTVYRLGPGGVPGSSVSIDSANQVAINDGAGGSATFALAPSSGIFSGANQLAVGSYQLGARGIVTGNSANFSNIITVTGAHQVNTKGITASASNVIKVYDGTTGMTGVTLSLATPEVNDAVAVNGSGAFSAKDVGTNLSYTLSNLTLTGADAANYHLTGGTSFSGNNGTISAAPLIVRANNTTKTYGAPNPVLTTTITGFVNGETLATSGVTGQGLAATTATSSTGAGSVVITAGAGTLAANNYSFSTFANGTLTIAKANATVTANSANLTYSGADQTVSGFTASGLVAGDTVAVLTGVSASRSARNAGTYAVTASGADPNYNLNFIDGALVINPAPLTVTANNATKTFDGVAFTGGNGVSFSGFVAGETHGDLGGSLSYGGTSQGAVNPGAAYTIIPAGLASSNYTISYVNGTLTIHPANVPAAVSSAPRTAAQVQSTVPVNPLPGRLLPNATPPPLLTMQSSTTITSGSSGVPKSDSLSSINPGITIDLREVAATGTTVSLMAAVSLPKGTSTVGVGFNFDLPEAVRSAFKDASSTQVSLANGAPLPAWLKFDVRSFRFQAQAVPDGGLPLQVTLSTGGERVFVVISERSE